MKSLTIGCFQPFWSLVNRVCEELTVTNGGEYRPASQLNCSNPAIFTLWLLKDLNHIYEVEGHTVKIEIQTSYVREVSRCSEVMTFAESGSHLALQSMKSNYHLLDSSLKLFLRADASESELRTVLLLVENILKSDWEERTEPLALLWEYFHKRMNSSFLVPGASISEMAIIG